jgi:alkanesulfonate monooxygenase SsuD/methylene tetrahydromethanopterin reductase-like flavin-dependent oxidoreductase (luciferase family)
MSVIEPGTSPRVALTLDLRNPAPWARPTAEFYARTLERVVEAERLGVGSVWLSEHHLFEDGYLPQPLTFAAAIAARTQQIRIGTGILIAPLRKAIDIAEQAAIVDVLSNGRLELGLGAGYAEREFAAFGVEQDRRHRLLRENAREILRLWTEGGVTPSPVQTPPPLWIGALGPQLARFAGRLGAGLLSAKPELLPVYRDALDEAGHGAASARCAGNPHLILADDPEAVWPRLSRHIQWMVESYGRAAVGTSVAASFPTQVDPAMLRQTTGIPRTPAIDVVTPDEALKRIAGWAAERPLSDVIFFGDLAGAPDDILDRHVELLGRHVVGSPALRAVVPTAS